MKSKTKRQLTVQQVQALCQKHFGTQNADVAELSGGMFNAAYLVQGSGLPGGRAVLKVGPAPGTHIMRHEKDIMRTEVQLYHRLEGLVPVPKIYAEDFTQSETGGDYFFMQALCGHPWLEKLDNLAAEETARLKWELGRHCAALHTVDGTYFGYPKSDTRFHHKSWGDAMQQMFGDILQDAQDLGHRLPYGEIAAAVRACRPLLDEVTTPTLIDWDMWAGNIFIERQNGHYTITGIIDWERAFYGDPYAEFVGAFMLLDDVENETAFIESYSEATGTPLTFTPRDRTRMDLYRLYLNTIMHTENYRYTPPRPEWQQSALAEIQALLLRLPKG